MPRDKKGLLIRKTVSERFRIFVALLLQQFQTPPAELLKRAEEKAAERPAPLRE